MQTIMNSSPPKSINEVKVFLQLENCKFKSFDKKESYRFIRKTTWNLKYMKLSKAHKGLVIKYVSKVLGYSNIQSKKLIGKSIAGELTNPKTTKNRTSFKKKYLDSDIKLLAEFDSLANFPNGFGLQKSLQRMYDKFKDDRFIRLSEISHGHIYTLRKTNVYKKITLKYEHTKPISQNEIGSREKPNPEGKPGYIRVDSVHGGEKDGKPGVFYVNLVDEITQTEIVICVKGISERFLSEVWEELLVSFPFRIINFHSDNGSEFINQIVAGILNKLNIKQTKSRPRHSNDNGLVETKNGWIIRKHFGYVYVHQECAPVINEYLIKYFNRFLNYHRACAFPERIILANGKVKVVYKKDDYNTPYEKLKLIDPNGKYLQDGLTYAILDKIGYEFSDFEYLKILKEAQIKMLRKVKEVTQKNLLTVF